MPNYLDNILPIASLTRGEELEISTLPDPSAEGVKAAINLIHRQTDDCLWVRSITTGGTRIIKRIK